MGRRGVLTGLAIELLKDDLAVHIEVGRVLYGRIALLVRDRHNSVTLTFQVSKGVETETVTLCNCLGSVAGGWL